MIAALDAYFATCNLKARRLNCVELQRIAIHPAALTGWRLIVPVLDRGLELDFILDIDAPYSMPRIFLFHPPRPLTWPHVEEDGKVCLAPDGATVASFPPEESGGVARSLLQDACKLVSECAQGQHREDFLVEWPAYWRRAKPVGLEFYSLLALRPPSRLVSLWRRSGFYLVAEDRPQGNRWLSHRLRKNTDDEDQPAALVWLERPPYPEEYPTDTLSLLRIVRSLSEDGARVIDRLAGVRPERLAVVLAAASANTVGAGGFVVARPGFCASGKGGRHMGLHAGFRPGHTPEAVERARYLTSAPGMRSIVKRVDAAWIHGRDRCAEVDMLRKTRVVLIGCGSLGGPVARLLIQAGVGSSVLIDPDDLDWPNTSRHTLGADQVDKNKAKALADRLKTEFQHAEEVLGLDVTWQDAFRANPGLFERCDLVVAASGDWNSESALNDMQRSKTGFPPVVYTWLEDRAAAAHAVVIGAAGACLRCGHSDLGSPIMPVTGFPPEPQHEGACALPTSPYGAAAATHAHGLVAELAIDVLMDRVEPATHRVWIAPLRLLEREGGIWDSRWIEAHGDPGEGGHLRQLTWLQRSNCVLCGRQAVA